MSEHKSSRNSSRRSSKVDRHGNRSAQVIDLHSDYNQFDHRVDLKPKTITQDIAIKSIRSSEVSALIGPAGVGKTFITAGLAAEAFLEKGVDKIILTRANVGVGKTLGALPGTIEEKMNPLLRPVLDALERHLTPGRVKYMLNKQQIEMMPFEYVRGRSFRDEFVIIDEAQNLSEEDMIAIVTRYESGRVVLLGDPVQNDLKTENGLVWLSNFCSRNKIEIPIIHFSLGDIVRSKFVKDFLIALYHEKGYDG